MTCSEKIKYIFDIFDNASKLSKEIKASNKNILGI